MKAFVAASIAAALLYVVDAQYNDGRYAESWSWPQPA